uniref:Secreted protein n=1 Tax=Zea mays TaxID=4577 RepID=A0A804UHL1_MAIZE
MLFFVQPVCRCFQVLLSSHLLCVSVLHISRSLLLGSSQTPPSPACPRLRRQPLCTPVPSTAAPKVQGHMTGSIKAMLLL